MQNYEEKVIEAFKKNAPKNMRYDEFKKMIDENPKLLDNIHKFSTFNPELATVCKSKISDTEKRQKLRDSMDENIMEKVAHEHANMYIDIICTDDKMLQRAWLFDILTRKQRQEFGQEILEKASERLGIDKKIKLKNINKRYQQPFKNLLNDILVRVLIKLANKLKHKDLVYIKWDGFYDTKDKIILLNPQNFFYFINTVAHEYGHFIDKFYPDLGMLGTQTASESEKVYDWTEKNAYRNNPTEASSFKIGATVSEHMQRALLDQVKAKPELYAKTLEQIRDWAKAKKSALELKHKISKRYAEYQRIKTKEIKKIEPSLIENNLRIHQKEQTEKLTPEENEQCLNFNILMQKISKNPKVEAAWAKYEKSIPQEYKDLDYLVYKCDETISLCNSNNKSFLNDYFTTLVQKH